MNERPSAEKLRVRFDGLQLAERQLLYAMMTDKEVAAYVQEKLDDKFIEDIHSALAAYLYSYYAHGNEPDIACYLAYLQDNELRKCANAILSSDIHKKITSETVDANIKAILEKTSKVTGIEQLREQYRTALKNGDSLLAAQIDQQILTLEKRQKSS